MTTEERLEKLERELAAARRRNRWMFWGGVVLLAGCLVISVWPHRCPVVSVGPHDHSGVIYAKQFIVVDDNGRNRASMSMGKDGPSLVLSDENGKHRAAMFMDMDGPKLNLYDENERIQASLYKTIRW